MGTQLFVGFLPSRSFSFALFWMADSTGRVFVGAVGDFGLGKDTAHHPKINAVNTPGVVSRVRRAPEYYVCNSDLFDLGPCDIFALGQAWLEVRCRRFCVAFTDAGLFRVSDVAQPTGTADVVAML